MATSRLHLGMHYPIDLADSAPTNTAGIMFWLPLWNDLVEARLLWMRRPVRDRHR